MKKPIVFNTLEDKFEFGLYQGQTLGTILQSDTQYIRWCIKEIPNLRLSKELKQIIKQRFEEENEAFKQDISSQD